MMGLFDGVGSGGSSTAPGPRPVAQSEEMRPGARYTIRFECMGRFAADTPAKIRGAIAGGVGLNNALAERHFILRNMVTVEAVRVSPPDPRVRVFAWPTFAVEVDLQKTGPGTPVVVVVGILAAILLFAVGMGFVVTRKEVFERVSAMGENFREFVSGSAVPLVLALGLGVFFWRGGR